jgi:uncharacterized protein YbjT (DUF2867 family)
MATPFEEGVDGELRQARRGAEACMQAGVKHLVYSSVAGADRETGVPHFESKRQVELFLRGLGVPITILAPVFFMENLLRPAALQALSTGTLTLPLPRRRALRVVSVLDVAAMARLAFERPGVFQGKRIELAADDLTGPGMAAVLSQVTRSTIGYAETPLAAVRERSADLARMFEWLAERGYDTDIERLRAMHPEVGWHDFRSWARQQDWSVLDVASAEQPTI